MSRSNNSRAEKKQKRISSHLEKINLFAAGIDIGSETHFVAMPEDLDDKAVRSFSCFTGKTGMIFIRAIIDGERDPGILAEHRNNRCKKSVEDIAKSLKGN